MATKETNKNHEPTNLEELRKKLLFDVNTPDDDEHICLYIADEKNKSIIGTFGNISVITGKAKSRKTYVITSIVGALLKKGNFLNFTADLPEGKDKILLFDTEQGKKHSKKCNKRCLNIADLPDNENNNRLHYYRLRGMSPYNSREFIEYVITNTENVGFVIIDGIKDLVCSINDEKEATEICS